MKGKEQWKEENRNRISFYRQNLDWSEGENTTFCNADFRMCSMKNARFRHCSFQGADLRGADLRGSDFRGCDLREADLRGADIRMAILEKANLDGIKTDTMTKGFRMCCPETGAFVAYKKCLYDRIVQLFIPADAKRSSATGRTCRCDKAKVLSVRSIDCRQEYDEAWSLVDEQFVYRKGSWVYADAFTEDRFQDSTHGIHFWMTRDEAIQY